MEGLKCREKAVRTRRPEEEEDQTGPAPEKKREENEE